VFKERVLGKYEPLGQFLRKQKGKVVTLTFAELERVIRAKLPKSSKTHRAWWSNNPDNNVMTREWLAAGYATEDVDIAGEQLTFRRIETTQEARPKTGKPSFWGCMKGVVTLPDDFDPSRPFHDDTNWDDYEIGGMDAKQ
jgi:hypothetical protein